MEARQSLDSIAAQANDTGRARRLLEDECWRCSALEDCTVTANVIQCKEGAFDFDLLRSFFYVFREFGNVLLRQLDPSEVLRPQLSRGPCRCVEGFVDDKVIIGGANLGLSASEGVLDLEVLQSDGVTV